MSGDIPLEEWPDLKRALDSHHGILGVPVEVLRGLAAGTRGRRTRMDAVREEIEEHLTEINVGVWPELPMRAQGRVVLLYYRGTEAAEVIRLFEAGNVTQVLVRRLRKLNTPSVPVEGAGAVLDLMREVEEKTAELFGEQPRRRSRR